MLAESNLRLHKAASNRSGPWSGSSFSSEEPGAFLEFGNICEDVLQRETIHTQWCVVNSLYDYLGFIAPITMQGKALVRELLSEQNEWDAPLHKGKQIGTYGKTL